MGLHQRELEQAVIATFLHSQPIGQSARLADLTVLLAPGRPDRIEVQIELGDGKSTLSDQLIQEVERLLKTVQEGFGFNR